MKHKLLSAGVASMLILTLACSSQDQEIDQILDSQVTSRAVPSNAVQGTNGKYIYLPSSVISDYNTSFNFRTADLNNSSSYFCWQRSKQSDNFVIFWESGFGTNPATCTATIDNVSMKEVGTDVELIKNGDFENGSTAGWGSWTNAQGLGEGYAE